MTTPNMSCPSGGTFWACGEGSRFVGCCASDPCTVGCPAGNLKSTSFDAAQYGQIPDQQCSTGQFYTCAYTEPPFWGCCSSGACSGTGGCDMSALAGAFLSQNPETAEPFLSLNETWSTDGATSTASEPITHHSHTNTGAIAGGVVGGVAVLAAFVFGLLWLYRRRKREAASTVEATSTQETPPSDPGMQTSGLKELPQSWNSSPMMPSYHSTPQQKNGEWSPRPPSYWSGTQAKPQHMSYELPGSEAGIEMDSVEGPVRESKEEHRPSSR